MLDQIRTAIHRSQETLLPDAIGALSLIVMLVVGLHLPAFT
ncbi:hypothetical protein [Puniceibacterium sediminis]|nr:hypothetical protein [Puniceibacterium sediminis]